MANVNMGQQILDPNPDGKDGDPGQSTLGGAWVYVPWAGISREPKGESGMVAGTTR
jgi:hypothetical protein